MKKTMIFVMALMLCLCCCATAFASEKAPTIKISQLYLSAEEINEDNTPASPAGTVITLDNFDAFYNKNEDGSVTDSVTFDNNVATYVGGVNQLSFDLNGPNWLNLKSLKYVSVKIENTESFDVKVSLIMTLTNAGGNPWASPAIVYPDLYDENGVASADCKASVENKTCVLTIPAGKSVYAVVPVSGRNIPNFGINADKGGFELVDNSAWSGASADTAIHLSQVLFATAAAEGNKPTADFSVIAYAVAAITGCGALVVAKKRG